MLVVRLSCIVLAWCAIASALTSPNMERLLSDSGVVSLMFRVPYAGLELSINIQTDSIHRTQAIEFFNGMYTEYFSNAFPRGIKSVYNISDRICIQEDTDPEGPSHNSENIAFIRPFPDLHDFRYVGETIVRGLQVEEWVKTVGRPGETESFYYDPKLEIPVRWIMNSRDEIFDSHLDEYIVDYITVKPLDHAIDLPQTCRTRIVNLQSNQASGGHSILHKFKRHHLHRSKEDRYPMGYIPSHERPRILIYGDRVSVSDLPDLKSVDIPDHFDWRHFGGSPKPKDQIMCGSCYAFSVIGAIESQLMRLHGMNNTAAISEQFILDCGWSDGVSSCSGGNQEEVGRVLLERYDGFIPHDDAYGKYMSTYSYCKNTTGFPGIRIDAWVSLPTRMDDESIKKFLMHYGLLSVSINAVDEIVFYKPDSDGVIRSKECRNARLDDLNHAVNLVGFGTSEKGDYWILRNSWSTHWGDEGYFKVEMGEGDCGISLDVSFPIIHDTNAPILSTPENSDDATVVS